ncbi:hypothetical protein [Endozoicomonas sp. 8E]|uniref:hypothetical protein n=1 Tax=Endozoicomonas sp. 8E TaxID=3035692 RepID=UPI002938F8B1|nr:hypothetical protein [Endozoicomonas sp. 8E]WOG27130.1 hypothetical protein P6910_21645 [Endozoicomonas sp. 8E]
MPSLSVICQDEPWTERFIVELVEDAGSPNQSFSVWQDRQILPGNLSDIAETNGYSGSFSMPDDRRHRPLSYGEKTPLIESTSWQWLYATRLLVSYELFLTTRDSYPNFHPYSWLPAEASIAVGWLLKNYWNPDSPLFNLIEQQTASILTQGDYLFAITTMMPDSGNEQQGQPSESSCQQAPKTTTYPADPFTTPQHPGSGDGNRDPQQYSHTLGLNCFLHPCHGVCWFRPSSENTHSMSTGATTNDQSGSLNDDVPMFRHFPITPDDWDIVNGLLNLRGHSILEDTGASCPHTNVPPQLETLKTQQTKGSSQGVSGPPHLSQSGAIKATGSSSQPTIEESMVGENDQKRPCIKVLNDTKALSDHKSRDPTEQQTCTVTVMGEDGQKQPCGTVCKNIKALKGHKRRNHTGQQTCNISVVEQDGLQWPCGKVCNNSQGLKDHKIRHHSVQRICSTTIIAENGQQRPCGKACNNAQALKDHKRRQHCSQKYCDVTVVGQDGLPRSCGAVFKNSGSLSCHKNRIHSGQQTCDVTVVKENGHQQSCGRVCKNAQALLNHKRSKHTRQQICHTRVVKEDGQQWPCGKVFRSAQALSTHKSRIHSGQQTCDARLVKEDGEQRPCGTVCKSKQALSDHKRKNHIGKQTCNVAVVGKSGQKRPCGTVCKNARNLLDHKRVHRKRKHDDD